MLAELQIELMKLLKKPRTYVGPVAMTCLVVLIMIAMKYGHDFRHMEERLTQDFMISGSFVNAVFLTRYVLLPPVLLMFLPLFSCMVFGDLLASEASEGTLRTLLCRPVTRLGVAMSKYWMGILYTVVLTFGMGAVAYILGSIFLGHGSLLSFTNGLWIIPERTAVIRLTEVYGLVALGMIATGSIAFAISTFLSNSNGAVASAVGIMIISSIIGEIDYFSALKPYLLPTYLLSLDRLFMDHLDLKLYIKSAEVMLAYAVVSLILGLVIFHKRDVLS